MLTSSSSRPPSASLEQTRAYMLSAIPPPAGEGAEWLCNFAIMLKEEAAEESGKRRMIGRVGVVRKGPRERVHWGRYGGEGEELAVAYMVEPEWWGRGVMTEAMGGFLGVYWGMGG